MPPATAWMVLGLAASKVFGAVDTGVANAYVVNPATPLRHSPRSGRPNSGGQRQHRRHTLAVSGLGAAPLVRSDGSPLRAGDLLAGQMVSTVCDGVQLAPGRHPLPHPQRAPRPRPAITVVDTGSANTLTVSPTHPSRR